jgi:DNA mismatch endonuclease (patch repair protein)
MADVLSPAQRSYNMSRIRGRNTKPEMIIRQGLHRAGLRFRLHASKLPGRPDLVFAKHKAVIFVHGCFWHGHSCPMFRLPGTRPEFWGAKIKTNCERDREVQTALRDSGWRVLTVWECCLTGPTRLPLHDVLCACTIFLCGTSPAATLTGSWPESPRSATR